jgi:hypothetical protein
MNITINTHKLVLSVNNTLEKKGIFYALTPLYEIVPNLSGDEEDIILQELTDIKKVTVFEGSYAECKTKAHTLSEWELDVELLTI